jgi:hypothetical protein
MKYQKPLARSLFVSCVLALAGCIEASQEPVAYDAVVVSQDGGKDESNGWVITLSRADVALGPFYFCASASGSSTLCASSIAEVASVRVVDALAPGASPLGRVHGFSGNIQSVSYDFGISWFDTQTSATPAPMLPGGHSMRLEGEARKGTMLVPFTADVDVVPQYQGQNAISTAPAVGSVASSATRLEVLLEPAAWMRQVDFDAIAAKLGASGKAAFAIEPGMEEHGAVLVGLKNLAPPELRWVAAP